MPLTPNLYKPNTNIVFSTFDSEESGVAPPGFTIAPGDNVGTGSGTGGQHAEITVTGGQGANGGNIRILGGNGSDANDGNGGDITVVAGDGDETGSAGDIILTPGTRSGVSPGLPGKVRVTRGTLRVPIYSSTFDRDTSIDNPQDGDIIFVDGVGLQFYRSGDWKTVAVA